MGHVDIAGVDYYLADGRLLLSDVSFRVGDGAKVALVGANGAGKTTLMRPIAGDVDADAGGIVRSGVVGVMRQFIGNVWNDTTVRQLLLSVSAPPIRAAASELEEAETSLGDDAPSQMRCAGALARWADAGGYEASLEIVPSPYRGVVQPLVSYLRERRRRALPGTVINVVVPVFMVPGGWRSSSTTRQDSFSKRRLPPNPGSQSPAFRSVSPSRRKRRRQWIGDRVAIARVHG